ncbi:phospholipid phosphatase 1-like [Ruditapes philippinarum]|uniref:phospholipid phosphatase 1-like n=1 Tax=Ruditapes philippinarum TaxID=129788 RepID=UPI00295C2BC6|nr:phospholipid phosphatase 1-like [Ruditapes philippinarum]
MSQFIVLFRRHVTIQSVLDTVLWLAVAIPVLILFLYGTPHERGFLCDDPSLSFPYKTPTLSTSSLLIVSAIVPLLVVFFIEVVNCIDKKCRSQFFTSGMVLYIVNMYAIFLVGFIIQQGVVEVIKSRMGVLRPNFFDVCKPHFNVSLCPGYITKYTCTGSDLMEIRDSRLSFPSGHSSLAMYIAVFFCVYIDDRLQIINSNILKPFLQSGLVFIAVLCGVDRIMDNKHHPSDVVAGFVLGVVVGLAVYYKIARNVLPVNETPDKSDKHVIRAREARESRVSRDCYTYDESQEMEPQSPLPLLQHENLDDTNPEKNGTVSTQMFLDTPFKARRHFSTPITPTFKSEDGI